MASKAYYIKLGTGGVWEEDAIKTGKLRLGWKHTALADINQRHWTRVRSRLGKEIRDKGAATRDFNALKSIAESTENDLWMTFHNSSLWWCRLKDAPMDEDRISKFRATLDGWHDKAATGRRLLINAIPGALAALQRFSGTACAVHEAEKLKRLIDGHRSAELIALDNSRIALVSAVQAAIKELHWKDFETLVDLVFRGAGWRRLSLLGEQMKFTDLELQEPITGKLYQVQVKSKADIAAFEEYDRLCQGSSFAQMFFVVHSPSPALERYKPASSQPDLILSDRLAEMIVDGGLTKWLMDKVS